MDTHAICRALVPNTRALSYLVMYGVVILFWLACWPSPAGRICTFSWSSCKQRQNNKQWDFLHVDTQQLQTKSDSFMCLTPTTHRPSLTQLGSITGSRLNHRLTSSTFSRSSNPSSSSASSKSPSSKLQNRKVLLTSSDCKQQLTLAQTGQISHKDQK